MSLYLFIILIITTKLNKNNKNKLNNKRSINYLIFLNIIIYIYVNKLKIIFIKYIKFNLNIMKMKIINVLILNVSMVVDVIPIWG